MVASVAEVLRASLRLSRSLPWLLLAAFWLVAAHTLQPVWIADPHYQYGWAVPLLCAWLFAERWRSRPAPGIPNENIPGFVLLLVLLLVSGWPIRLVHEAFPDWRPVLWAAGFWLVALTLALLHRVGGRPWLRHFGFPVAFVLTAIPWPTLIERPVLNGLMHLDASAVTHTLTLLGQPALQRGNLIETASGLLGIDEACSGMRSIQAAVMIALFLGEWFRLRRVGRLGLVAAGLALAFGVNFGRSLLLAWTAARRGMDAVAENHDPAGWATLGICVAGLWLFAWMLRDRENSRRTAPVARPTARPLPGWTVWMLGAGLLVAEGGTEIWYRWRESTLPPAQSWSVAWPESRPDFRRIEIRPAVRAVLQIDTGAAAAWRSPDGVEWFAHWLRWEPRPVARAILAQFHTPDVCLPAAGCLLRAEAGIVAVATAAGAMPFRGYTFEEDGRAVFVFYLLTEDRNGAPSHTGGSLPVARLRLVWEGKRHTGQTALHIAIRGLTNEAEAVAALQREVATLVVAR